MKNKIASLICTVVIGLAAPAEAISCKKLSELARPCFWTKGLVTDSADAGDVISIAEEERAYVLDDEPDLLLKMPKGRHLYIIGDYLFCPFPQRIHQGSGELWNYGCVERFRNVTTIDLGVIDMRKPDSDKVLADRVCHLVDCNRPGFKEFRGP